MSRFQKPQPSFFGKSASWTGSAALFLAMTAPPFVRAQPARRPAAPSLSAQRVTLGLQWLVQHSPVIFSGEVLTVDAPAPDIPTSTVDIRVDQGFRGVQEGETFRLVQWRGAGELALLPHQRVILFLHQPNAAGLSSSVSGSFGLLNVGGGAMVNVRSLQMLGAQRSMATGRAILSGADALQPETRNPKTRKPVTRNPITLGPPQTVFITEDLDSLPERQVFAIISALLVEQQAGQQQVRKEAGHGR